MSSIVPAHGGLLKPLLVADKGKKIKLQRDAENLTKIILTSREVSDVIMLAAGSFSPLEGFMCKDDYESVIKNMRLTSGILWPIPITLAISKETADRIDHGQRVALVDPESDEIIASMIVEGKFSYDKKTEAAGVFGTDDRAHPGVKKIYDQGEVYLGGSVEAYSEGQYPEKYPEYATPAQTRAIFEEKGWNTIAAFQTRNPLHRSHEYLTKVALEVCDGVFIHPIVGKLKDDDIPADIRMKCYKVLLENYYPQNHTVLKVYPMEMRYGGPKEAVLHAIIRQNFGCSHIIIGRDHAGVGNYYGAFEAQDIFDRFTDGELAIKPLKLDWTFWCYKCGGMASMKTCPHSKEDRCLISGTKLRDILSQGILPPAEFSRPEVLKILIDYYRSLDS